MEIVIISLLVLNILLVLFIGLMVYGTYTHVKKSKVREINKKLELDKLTDLLNKKLGMINDEKIPDYYKLDLKNDVITLQSEIDLLKKSPIKK